MVERSEQMARPVRDGRGHIKLSCDLPKIICFRHCPGLSQWQLYYEGGERVDDSKPQKRRESYMRTGEDILLFCVVA
jgi:hypothetical protein